MPEPTGTAPRRREILCRHEHRLLDPRENKLRDPVTLLHYELLIGKVGEDYFHLSAIVAVYGAGRIEHEYALTERKPRPRPDLQLPTRRNLTKKTGRNDTPSMSRNDRICCGADIGT